MRELDIKAREIALRRFGLPHCRLKGFNFLRIIPVHREVNKSTGVVAEQYGVQYHTINKSDKENETFIEYADVVDTVKMLNMKSGGSYVDGVRDSLYLFDEE